jgi:hypothetical protein
LHPLEKSCAATEITALNTIGSIILILGALLFLSSHKTKAAERKMKGALGIVGSLFTLSGTILLFAFMVQKSDAQAVAREIGTATQRMEKQLVGIKRAELFYSRLKKIDPRYAPATVKRALKDYIDALEQDSPISKPGIRPKLTTRRLARPATNSKRP